MFTRKHLVSVAATLANEHYRAVSPDAKIAVENAVQAFADTFEATSPTFNRRKFTAAFEQMVANFQRFGDEYKVANDQYRLGSARLVSRPSVGEAGL